MTNMNNCSEKDWTITLVLCLLGGGIGAHRYYVGKVGTGILYTLTVGLLVLGISLTWSRSSQENLPIKMANTSRKSN